MTEEERAVELTLGMIDTLESLGIEYELTEKGPDDTPRNSYLIEPTDSKYFFTVQILPERWGDSGAKIFTHVETEHDVFLHDIADTVDLVDCPLLRTRSRT